MTTSCSSRSCPPAGALSVPGADHPTGCTGKPSLDYRFVSGTIIEGTATGKSRLTYALMAVLDIGLKISTLPVAALGVGIGVDYGIYVLKLGVVSVTARFRGTSWC